MSHNGHARLHLSTRWSTTPWVYGSYSNWPPRLTLEGYQNLRAHIGRVRYASEATSSEFYGSLHGASFEGKDAGRKIAAWLNDGTHRYCSSGNMYETLYRTTRLDGCGPENGWTQTSSQTVGDVDPENGGGLMGCL